MGTVDGSINTLIQYLLFVLKVIYLYKHYLGFGSIVNIDPLSISSRIHDYYPCF